MSLRHSYGTVFRQHRLEDGMTVNTAAAQLGLSPSTLTSYERGDRWPGPDHLETLVDFYRITGSELLPSHECSTDWGHAIELCEALLKELRR